MSANYPVVPVGGSALLRVFASVLAVITHWLKEFARARRHRREANVLAGLDRRMLADIGITRTMSVTLFPSPSGTTRLHSCANGRLNVASATRYAPRRIQQATVHLADQQTLPGRTGRGP